MILMTARSTDFASPVCLSNSQQATVLPLWSVSVCVFYVLFVSEAVDAASISHAPVGGVYLLKMALALVVVLGAFYLLARIARQLKGVDYNNPGILGVLTGVSVGTRERLVIVQAGDVQMLLGISPAGIVKLREFETDVIPRNESSSAEPFKAQMEKLLGRAK